MISHGALLTLADICEDEVAGRTDADERHAHDKRFTGVLVRRGLAHVFAGDRHSDCLATTEEGRTFIRDNLKLICAGLTQQERDAKRAALGFAKSPTTKTSAGSTYRGTLVKHLAAKEAECEGLRQAVATLTAERDELKTTLAKIEKDCEETDTRQVKDLGVARAERDYCHSQLLYAHRLAATGTRLDDIEKMRVVFGLIMNETKPRDPNPWWNVATFGLLGAIGAMAYATYAPKKDGAK